MRERSARFPHGIEYWAAESVQEQSDQRALMMAHTVRTQVRFWLFVAALVCIVLFSVELEYIRLLTGGATISVWRCLAGMVPGLLWLVAVLGISTAFVQDVYGAPSWGPALRYVWLLLFGRAPFSLLYLLQWALRRLFSSLGLSPPPAIPFATYPHLIVWEGRVGEEYEDTLHARFGGPANLVVFDDSAVILERFGGFIRVVGPGAVFLRRFERIREVLDLRPQERSEVVVALSKDGIPVQTEVQVRFQLPRPPASLSPSPLGTPGPVCERAWIQAGQCHSRLIIPDIGPQRENRWPERVMGNVGSTMRAIIASYRLDELLEPREPDRDPRHEIVQKLRSELNAAARSFGVQVLDIRMGTLEPMPEEVDREWITTWQAAWKSRARIDKAIGEAEALRQRGLARAYIQVEIILTLARRFQEVIERGTTLSAQSITMQFIETLRQAWGRHREMAMPAETVRILDYLQQLVTRDYAHPADGTWKEDSMAVRVLFLTANPTDTARLRLDEESRAIDQALRQAEFRDKFDIRQHWAVRVSDIQEFLLRHKPDIVHFSGHGSRSSEIILEDNFGNSCSVPARALSDLFSVLKDNIRCVVLNACYSEQQARAIAEHIDCVVGMSRAIGDLSAISFATAFYRALGYGRDVETAFKLGCVEINLENLGEQDRPKLLARKSDPEKIVFVRND